MERRDVLKTAGIAFSTAGTTAGSFLLIEDRFGSESRSAPATTTTTREAAFDTDQTTTEETTATTETTTEQTTTTTTTASETTTTETATTTETTTEQTTTTTETTTSTPTTTEQTTTTTETTTSTPTTTAEPDPAENVEVSFRVAKNHRVSGDNLRLHYQQRQRLRHPSPNQRRMGMGERRHANELEDGDRRRVRPHSRVYRNARERRIRETGLPRRVGEINRKGVNYDRRLTCETRD